MWKKLLYLIVIIWMSKPIQSAVLECDWSQQYCTPYNITPVTKPNEVITISGKPLDFVDSTTVDLSFVSKQFNYIPSGLFTIFLKLESLNIDYCETTTLTTDSIPNCGVLISFILTGATITNIPAGFLQSCTNLLFLHIGETNATTIDVDAFRGLTNVNSLGITGSKISCLPLGLFQHTPSLTRVSFYSNMITSIDNNLFVNLPVLDQIDLSQNLISYVPVLNLTASTSSLRININSNPIYALAPGFCFPFETRPVDSFDINFWSISCVPLSSPDNRYLFSKCQNSIELQNCFSNWTSSMNAPISCAVQTPTTLPPTTLAPTTMEPTTLAPTTMEPTTLAPTTMEPTTLAPTTEVATTPSPNPSPCPSDKICRYFLDQYNRYTCILDGVDSVLTSISGNHLITFTDVDVRRIVFTNSFLSRIPSILFQKFANLEYLEAPNCSISVMNTNTFTECGNLRYFDVGYNLFTTVDGASLKSCSALEVVDLTGNKIDFISGQLFVNNPTLKTVYINKPPVIVLV